MLDLESMLLIWVCSAAFLPLVVWIRRRSPKWVGLAVMALWVGGSTALGLYAVKHRPVLIPRSEITDRPTQHDSDGYVTYQTCKSCHPDAYRTWHGSYHRSMTQLPTPENVIGDFNDVSVRFKGHTYNLERRGDEFWAELPDLISVPTNSVAPRIQRQIKLLTGSHHMQVYWISPDNTRKLSLLPIVWLKEQNRWIPRSASFLQPPNVETDMVHGRWNMACVRCHTTHEQPRLESYEEMDTRVGEFGIACEACHGPGQDHIKAHSEPLGRYASRLSGQKADATIAQPAKLSVERSSEVCGQCHAITLESNQEEFTRWHESGKSYRPGDVLADSLTPVLITNKVLLSVMFKDDANQELGSFWNDGTVRVSGREYNGLLESPCHMHGVGAEKLTCLSCHEMHPAADDPRPLKQWADDQLKPGMRSNQACLQCHSDIAEQLEAHTHHSPNSTGSLCYNCHMPHTTYGLLKAIKSHRVESPSVAASVQTGRPNGCNQCHLDKSLSWTAARLYEWYAVTPPELTADQKNIAASVLWALRGDAGQRALMAWSFGWKPASEISGTDWTAPYLAELITDPYDAVRLIAGRSLRRLPGFETFEYDFMESPGKRRLSRLKALEIWAQIQKTPGRTNSPATLIDATGELQRKTMIRLLTNRDNTPIVLNE